MNVTGRFCACPFYSLCMVPALTGQLGCPSTASPSARQGNGQSKPLGNALGAKVQVSNDARIKDRTPRTDPCGSVTSRQTKEPDQRLSKTILTQPKLSADHRSIFLQQTPPGTAATPTKRYDQHLQRSLPTTTLQAPTSPAVLPASLTCLKG